MSESQAWSDKDLSHFVNSTGEDIFDIHAHFATWIKDSRPGGYYLYELAASSAPGLNIRMAKQKDDDKPLLNLASYNYRKLRLVRNRYF